MTMSLLGIIRRIQKINKLEVIVLPTSKKTIIL